MLIEEGCLENPVKFLEYGSTFAIVTDERVRKLYGEAFASSLNALGANAHLFSFPPGEASKTRETKEKIEDEMLAKGLGRDTCLIALGGGVVTDLGGFIAATYARGLPLVLIPTTLLAMVDAAIGGKTGVNVKEGKNLIGAFYRPKKVVTDIACLKTLPDPEWKNGFVEMIKHGLIADPEYFEALEKSDRIHFLIERGHKIKKKIVREDEYETGKRRILNFGHTIGHALETFSNYAMSHGEAVALGMVLESILSYKLGLLDSVSCNRVLYILKKYSLPLKMPLGFTAEALLHLMRLDKKSSKGEPRFVLLEKIGSPHPFDGAYCSPVEEKLLREVLDSSHRLYGV